MASSSKSLKSANWTKAKESIGCMARAVLGSAFLFAVISAGAVYSTPAQASDDSESESSTPAQEARRDQLRAIYGNANESMDKRIAACKEFGGSDCTPETLEMIGGQPRNITDGNTGSGVGGEDVASCDATYKTTQLLCNTMSVAGLSPAEGAAVESMVGQMAQIGMSLKSSGNNASAQCKQQADLSKIMAAVNGIKGAGCGAMIKRCTAACEHDAEENNLKAEQALKPDQNGKTDEAAATRFRTAARKAKRNGRTCEENQANFIGMMMQSMQFAGNMLQNNQCAKQMSASAFTPAPGFSPIAYNPPSTDCSDPNNQTLACFCEKAANKTTPMCSGFNPTAGSGASPFGPNAGGAGTPYSPNIVRDGGDLDPMAGAMGQGKPGSGGRDPSDGGASAPGHGGLASMGGDGDGGGGAADPRSVITGTAGGQGGGLSTGGGGAGGGLAKNNGPKASSLLDRFNLKRFLPGSKYKARGVAGMSVKSVDGITGPMGPSIWEKATKQYQEQIQKQNVILDR